MYQVGTGHLKPLKGLHLLRLSSVPQQNDPVDHFFVPSSSLLTMFLYCHSFKFTNISTETPCSLTISHHGRTIWLPKLLCFPSASLTPKLLERIMDCHHDFFGPRSWKFSNFHSSLFAALFPGSLQSLCQNSPASYRCFASFANFCH